MKNISIIMGRGVEGCGVTKYTVEQVKWLKRHGYNTFVHAAKDKTYSRKNAHDLGDINHFKFSDEQKMNEMIEACNNSDLIIINSLPSKDTAHGAGSGSGAVNNWIRALKSFTKPVVLIQHDHSVHSIRRNASLDESIKAATLIFAHSRKNDFAEYVNRLTGGEGTIMSFFDDVEQKKVLNFQPGLDFDETRKRYWKPMEQQDPLQHKWIGRCTSWKGYVLMFDWHNRFLRQNGCITTFEGIERSPAFLDFRNLSPFVSCIDKNPNDVNLEADQDAYVFGPYINHEMLERMSRVGFGYQLSILDQKFVEKSIEYTHCELVASGTIPVFRKEYGQRCIHRVTGDPLIHSPNNGTVWLSSEGDNLENNIVLINELAKDSVLRDECREAAYEFYKSHQDSECVFDDLMKSIKENL